MSAEIRVAASPGEYRIAVTVGGALLDYAIERPGRPDGVGDVHRGRVEAGVPAMGGAFVALADGSTAFLPDTAGAAGLTEGVLIGVRISRAAQGGKGPRVAAVSGDAASVGPLRLIRRGAGPLAELAAHYSDAPILVDHASALARLRPLFGERAVLRRPAFGDALAAEIEALEANTVALPGGGYLHVHPTPALTALDLDAGAATGAREGKARAQAAANRTAMPAIARQIRLRNLSGAILIDFAGLAARKRAALGPELAQALAADPLHPRLLGFTRLGLAEIVRPRVRPPLHEMLAGPYAAGLAALRRVADEADIAPARALAVRVNPAIAAALEQDAAAYDDLANRTGRPLILRPDPSLPPGSWRLEDA